MTGPDSKTNVVIAKYGSRGRSFLLAVPAITTQQKSIRHSRVARKKLAANRGSSLENDEKHKNPLRIIIMNNGQIVSAFFFSTTIHTKHNAKMQSRIIGQYIL